MTALFIPSKIRVGFHERGDTFTGKLAYVIYYDEKGVLRKEGSWNSWRDKKIEPIDFDNTPTTGFLFNKGVQRCGEWFGTGRSLVRLHDPRDFEFEISIDNVINILMHSDVSKRDIVEPCVYAWSGTNLVLLPVNSEEYRASVEYTEKQNKSISTKDLVKGRRYYVKKSKDNEIVTYLGYFDMWDWTYYDYKSKDGCVGSQHKGKKHIFHTTRSTYDGGFKAISANQLSHAVSDDIVDDYAELYDKWFTCYSSSPIVSLSIEPIEYIEPKPSDYYARRYPTMYKIVDGTIEEVNCNITKWQSHKIEDFSLTMSCMDYSIVDKVGLRFKYRRDQQSIGNGYYHRTEERITVVSPQELLVGLRRCIGLGNDCSGRQYVDYMTSHGYGQVMATLKSGSKIKTYLR